VGIFDLRLVDEIVLRRPLLALYGKVCFVSFCFSLRALAAAGCNTSLVARARTHLVEVFEWTTKRIAFPADPDLAPTGFDDLYATPFLSTYNKSRQQ